MDRDNISIQTIIGVIFVIAALAIVPAVISVLTESVDNQVTTKSLVEEASYIIYQDGNYTCGKNGTTGRIEYRGEVFNDVLQEVIDDTRGTIFITKNPTPGNWTELYPTWSWELYDYELSNTTINVHGDVSIVGDDVVFLCRDVNTTIFNVNPSGEHYYMDGRNPEYSGMHFIGNASNTNFKLFFVNDLGRQPLWTSIYTRWVAYPIYIDGAVYSGQVDNCWLAYSNTAVTLTKVLGSTNPNAFKITNCDISANDVGIDDGGGYGIKISNNYFEANGETIIVRGGTPIISNNFISTNSGGKAVVYGAVTTVLLEGNEIHVGAASYGVYNPDKYYAKLIASGNNIYCTGSGAIGIYSGDQMIGSVSGNILQSVTTANDTMQMSGKFSVMTISANMFEGGWPALEILGGSSNTIVSGNAFSSCKIGIETTAYYLTCHGNRFKSSTIVDYLQTAGGGWYFSDNVFGSVPIIKTGGNNGVFENNVGYVTEKTGTATILNGQTSIIVTHGLATTPSMVIVTGSNGEVSACYVTSIGATTFTINVASAVSGNRVVYWYAEV